MPFLQASYRGYHSRRSFSVDTGQGGTFLRLDPNMADEIRCYQEFEDYENDRSVHRSRWASLVTLTRCGGLEKGIKRTPPPRARANLPPPPWGTPENPLNAAAQLLKCAMVSEDASTADVSIQWTPSPHFMELYPKRFSSVDDACTPAI